MGAPASGQERPLPSVADDDLERVLAYIRYVIDCPGCDSVIDLESDPSGGVVECDVCRARVWVESVR